MSKRKREGGTAGRRSDPDIVDLTDDSEEPKPKTAKPRIQSLKVDKKQSENSLPQPKPGPSTSRNGTNGGDQHRFTVPESLLKSQSSKGSGSGNGSKSNGSYGRKSDGLLTSPTPEQERRTNGCRQMRKAVIQVISEFHNDFKNQEDTDCSDLIHKLWICWKKYPLMFANASDLLRQPVEDLSTPDEIREFLPWWLHGLSSLMFFHDNQPFRDDLKRLLKTIAQFLIQGNSELVEVCFLELLEVLIQFSTQGQQTMKVFHGLKVTLRSDDEEDGSENQLDIQFQMIDNNENAVSDFLDILRMFLPRVFCFKVIERQRFLVVLRKFWTVLDDRARLKLFSTFFVSIMPLLPFAPIPTEISTTAFLTDIISHGSKLSDSHCHYAFSQFCSLLWKGVLPMGLLPESFLLRLHSSISELVVSDNFNEIPSDIQRKGIVQLYLSLTGEYSKIYEDGKLRQQDIQLFLKTSKNWSSVNILHPLVEETIFNELKTAFHIQTSEDLVANSLNSSNGRSLRVAKINSRVESKLWGIISKEFDSSISSVPENKTATFETLKKLCLTVQLEGRLSSRLLDCVMNCQSSSNKNAIWTPDFGFFNGLQKWTNLTINCILTSLRAHSLSVNPIIHMILESIDATYQGNLLLRVSCQLASHWLCIAGLPWLSMSKLKNRLPKKFISAEFFQQLSSYRLDTLSTSTKAKCLKTLSLKVFLPWKDFVVAIILNILETNFDEEFVLVLLGMIASNSWTIRSIPWSTLVAFIHKVISRFDWRKHGRIRIKLAKSIVMLPCIYTNQRQRGSVLDIKERLKLEIQPCSMCKGENQANLKENVLNLNLVLILTRLSLPILESRFLLAKLELVKLISSIRIHSHEFSKELVAAFTTTAVRSCVSLGTEIMKHLCFYFRPPPSMPSNPDPYFERTEAIQRFFSSLNQQLESSLEKQKFVRFAVKSSIILQQIASNADQLIMVEILKFGLRILVRRDSNVINMLVQSLVGSLASKSGCLPWELLTRLRYELAEDILSLMMSHCVDITDSDRDSQADRGRAFFNSICIMGEFRMAGIFIHHFYPILLGFMIPTLHEDKKMQFIFKIMSDFASVSTSQILQDGFHNYYRALVLGHNTERVVKAFAFLKKNYGVNPNVFAFSVLQGSMNEMLCYLNERKEKVVKFIPQLLRRDGLNTDRIQQTTTPCRSETQELISKHLMGFFVFVDNKLHSRLESISTKRRVLQSFTALIELMGKTRMTTNRTKVYATLNSLSSLGPDFHDLLYEAWKMFASNLDDNVFGQMSAQIIAAVLVLRDTVPEQVDNLISSLVLEKNELIHLYFLLDYTKNSRVLQLVASSVNILRTKSWRCYFEMLVKESSNENSHIRYRAIKKLNSVIIEEYESLHEAVLEKEHPVVSQVVNSFLNASRDADNEMLMLLAESLGALGAVDPYRFKDVEGDELKRKCAATFTVMGPNFAAKFLDLLIREFQESEDTTDFDYCACLIQQVLKHFNVTPAESDPVWFTMSASSRSLVEPLLTSKYRVEKELPKPDICFPIYLSQNGKSFDQWLSNWLYLMITYVKEGTPAYDLFRFTKYMISRNNRIASFLLPYVTTFAVIGGNTEQRKNVVQEIETILQRWIDQDALKVNSQIMMPVKDNQTDLGTPEVDTKMICNESVFQYRCTQEIFSVFDHLFRGVRHAKRQAGLLKANASKIKSPTSRPVEPINPSLTEDNAETISRVLSQIPMHTVSQVAFHCEDYTRALFYVEQDLKKTPEKLQDSLNYLQQLYVSLNDMDSVVGVSVLRKREPTMSEIILENIAKGKMEVAVRSLECMTSANPNDLIAHNGLLEAYLNVDEPRKAENLIKGCLSRNPQWEMALNEVQIQATWKLRDWTKLKTQIASTSNNGLSDTPLSWNMTIIKILSFVKDSKHENALRILKECRVKLMNPLVAAANDSNAYSRGYSNVVQLHILTEVEQVIGILQDTSEHSLSLKQRIRALRNKWDARLNIVLKSQKFVDSVLDVRRTLLETLKESISPDAETLRVIDGSIRDCWLKVATVESKAGNFTRASNCIVEAKKYMSAKVMIEHAKLLARKGDKEEAIRVLQTGMSCYFPQIEEWKRPGNAAKYQPRSEDMKLCSKALLLHAKLCDEQQLLDFEENINNYKSSTEVFRESEKNFYTLASYYDRMWSNKEEKSRESNIQSLLVRYYALSLQYGCKYVYQSLPRLLSIWFDYAAIGYGSAGSNNGNYNDSPPEEWSLTVSQMQDSIKTVLRDVPTYVMLTAFSQLISRLCHGNPSVWDLLKEIIGSIICNHPHQALWMTMAVSKSSYDMRQKRCKEIYKSVERKKPNLKKMIGDYTLLADKLITVCVKEVPPGQTAKMSVINKTLPKLLSLPTFSDVLIPFQVFLSPSLPLKGAGHKTHDAFPQKLVFIRGVDENVAVMQSLQKPKKINMRGSNGKSYGLLCKAKDDLRKDCKVMEVNNVVNWYLRRNPDSRQRQLYVRMYAVSPLNEEHGLLEWVPDLSGFRGSVFSLYKDRGTIVQMREIKAALNPSDPLSASRAKYLSKLIKPFPPVFSEWFLNNFNDPQAWYNARMCYTRTAAVMSIVGFVLGLGDRHGENILLDSSTGDIVHVDFNCLFNKGESFDVPERVPFRLTQNMTEGMGPLGVEGVFRRSCEFTMNVIREHKSIFLSVIHPFVFDPLVEWGNAGKPSSFTGEMTNGKAVEHMKHINNRIDGSARNGTKEKNTELSIEAQVAYLIDEARSIDNLCRMYIGWTAFL